MADKLIISVCSNFKKELSALLVNEEFAEVNSIIFPATCGRPPIEWHHLEKAIHKKSDCSRCDVFGHACIAKLTTAPQELNFCHLHKLEQCFHLFADPNLIDSYINEGAYLITPGWLLKWQSHLKQWGFEQDLAQAFFRESASRLLLVDTGTEPNSIEHLRDFAQFVKMPFETVPVGLGYFRLLLSQIVSEWRLNNKKNDSNMALNNAQQQMSKYAMAMDLLNTLARTMTESEVIHNIIDIFKMLFAPQVLFYLPVMEGQAGELHQEAFSSSNTIDSLAIQNRLAHFNKIHDWTESGNGFRLQITHRNKLLGILEVEQIAFPEYREDYLNLALTIVSVCGLAIYNARSFQRVTLLEERKQMQDALIKAKEEAESANRAKSEFLANISHEIRTPMNAIMGFSELLSTQTTDNKQKNYLGAIKTASKTLMSLIDDILDLSKIEAGKLDLQYDTLNTQFFFNELKQFFALNMIEKKLNLIIDLDKTLPKTLIIDEVRLRQVLINLIGNAFKFTEQGYIKLTIKKDDTFNNNNLINLLISVEDTGIGIPDNQKQIIFESFRQQNGQSNRKYGGTGLGLAISKRLVEMMKGQIVVKSVVNQGSVFQIILRDVAFSEDFPTVKQDAPFDVKTIRFEKALILIVDDEKSNRDLINEWLSQANLDLIEAENGETAIAFAEKYQPAVIFMDIRMPTMDGCEATLHLKNNPKTLHIPIIALTASVKACDLSKIKDSGFDGYLSKPVNKRDFFDELYPYLKSTSKSLSTRQPVEALKTSQTTDFSKFSEFNDIFDNEIIPIWQELNGALEIEVLENFAKKLVALGKQFHISMLIHYAEKLYEDTQHFEITDIKDSLKELPALLEKIRKNTLND
jgi:signal transduction histidine kinase/CheY-like chemotaxis protein